MDQAVWNSSTKVCLRNEMLSENANKITRITNKLNNILSS